MNVRKPGSSLTEPLLTVCLGGLTRAVAGVQVMEHGWAVDLQVLRRGGHVTDVSRGFGTAQHARLVWR